MSVRSNLVVARRRTARQIFQRMAEVGTRIVVATATFSVFIYACWMFLTSSS
jgi:hypothetical protein